MKTMVKLTAATMVLAASGAVWAATADANSTSNTTMTTSSMVAATDQVTANASVTAMPENMAQQPAMKTEKAKHHVEKKEWHAEKHPVKYTAADNVRTMRELVIWANHLSTMDTAQINAGVKKYFTANSAMYNNGVLVARGEHGIVEHFLTYKHITRDMHVRLPFKTVLTSGRDVVVEYTVEMTYTDGSRMQSYVIGIATFVDGKVATWKQAASGQPVPVMMGSEHHAMHMDKHHAEHAAEMRQHSMATKAHPDEMKHAVAAKPAEAMPAQAPAAPAAPAIQS